MCWAKIFFSNIGFYTKERAGGQERNQRFVSNSKFTFKDFAIDILLVSYLLHANRFECVKMIFFFISAYVDSIGLQMPAYTLA